MSDLGKQLWSEIAAMDAEAIEHCTPVRLTVTSIDDDGNPSVRRDGDDPDDDDDDITYVKLFGWDLHVGDTVYGLRTGNDDLIILGKIVNDDTPNPDYHSISGDLDVWGILSQEEFTVVDGAVFTYGMEIDNQGSPGVIDGLTMWTGDINVFDGVTNSPLDNPLFANGSQASSDTASTTNTTTLQDAISIDLTLTDGQWTFYVVGGVSLINSASATARIAAVIAANEGNIHTTPALSSTIYTACHAAHSLGAVNGNQTITCYIKYRCGSANTTTASNPWIMICARRTS
jgi:hypothetical protein